MVFDREILVRTLGGDVELAREIIAGFVVDVRRQLLALRETAETGTAGQIARQAHALKGASATVGAQGLMVEAARLEVDAKAAGDGQLERAVERAAALEDAFREFADDWEKNGLAGEQR